MRNLTVWIVVLLVCCWAPSAVFGQVNARISDVAKFKGPRVNRLQGIGLVVGLSGTGDGDDYKQAIQPLASWLKHYANPVDQLDWRGALRDAAKRGWLTRLFDWANPI